MAQDQRIHSFYNIDKNMVSEMLKVFDKSMVTEVVTPIHSGMSTSNYCVTVGKSKYLLKIYSGKDGNIEPIMYDYLQQLIHIPRLYYYDDYRNICPYSYAISASIYESFAKGHGGLPSDWLQLSKVADIPVMLGLLNVDNAPQDWVDDIEHDILEAVR